MYNSELHTLSREVIKHVMFPQVPALNRRFETKVKDKGTIISYLI